VRDQARRLVVFDEVQVSALPHQAIDRLPAVRLDQGVPDQARHGLWNGWGGETPLPDQDRKVLPNEGWQALPAQDRHVSPDQEWHGLPDLARRSPAHVPISGVADPTVSGWWVASGRWYGQP
jgi:hypothetical protein